MPPDQSALQARAWIKKARSDLRTIELLQVATDYPYDSVAFHAQQAAEKALKAVLTFAQIPFPRWHDLEELASLFPRDIAAELVLDPDSLGFLSQMAIAPRYPGDDDEIDEGLAHSAAAKAKMIFDRVTELLRRRGLTGV